MTADGDCSHEINRCLLLGRKVMTNLDSILKSKDFILPTKVCLVKIMVFPVVKYGCETWVMKKPECWSTDAFELWCWRRLLRVPWTVGHQDSLSIINSWSLLGDGITFSPSVVPFSCLQSSPASRSFPRSQFFASGGQSIGVWALASVLPMNTQDWLPLGLTGLISLNPRDSQESSPTPQFKSINSSALSFLYSPALISKHD